MKYLTTINGLRFVGTMPEINKAEKNGFIIGAIYDIDDNGLEFKKIQDIKKDEFFKRKAEAKKVWTKTEYDRTEKKYECADESDISNWIYLKKNTLVVVGFDY